MKSQRWTQTARVIVVAAEELTFNVLHLVAI
jgi:hypothetical protein